MNEHEEKIITSFFLKEKQDRYRFLLGSADRRGGALDRLNHCRDLNPKYVTWLPSNADVVNLLKKSGSPERVYLLSCSDELDGKTLSLKEALEATSQNGWGTIVSCIAGRLAYYYDEDGLRRALLKREPGT